MTSTLPRVSSALVLLLCGLACDSRPKSLEPSTGAPPPPKGPSSAALPAQPPASAPPASADVQGLRELDATAASSRACGSSVIGEPWLPALTTTTPVASSACVGTPCVPILPRTFAIDGCAPVRKSCNPTLTVPVARSEAVQTLLDAEWKAFAGLQAGPNCWLSVLDYTIHLDDHDLLSITFRSSGVGAYPDTDHRTVNLTLLSATPLPARALFRPGKADAVLALLSKRVRQAEAKLPAGVLAAEVELSLTSLDDYFLSKHGITFVYEFPIPHALQEHMPPAEYYFSYAELESALDPSGPLAWAR